MFKKLDESWFEDIYAIMKEAFPPSEYRDKEAQRQLFQLPHYEVYGYLKNDRLCAFLAAWNLTEFRFGEHLATKSELRNAGIGALLFRYYEGLSKQPLVFEVELPSTALAKRRIAFYERLGYHYYGDIEYYQGSFHPNQERLALRLMMNDAQADLERINHIIDLIYGQVYRQKRFF